MKKLILAALLSAAFILPAHAGSSAAVAWSQGDTSPFDDFMTTHNKASTLAGQIGDARNGSLSSRPIICSATGVSNSVSSSSNGDATDTLTSIADNTLHAENFGSVTQNCNLNGPTSW